MAKKGEAAAKTAAAPGTGLVLALLFGGGFGALLLLLLTLLISALVWSGSVPLVTAGLLLTVASGLCALIGGRIAVKKGSGPSLPLGCGVGGLLCLALVLVCLGTSGTEGFHDQFIGILLMTLAGGCLAGLLGKPKKRKKKKA